MEKKAAAPTPPENLEPDVENSLTKYVGELVDWLTGSKSDMHAESAQFAAQLKEQTEAAKAQLEAVEKETIARVSSTIEHKMQQSIDLLESKGEALEASISQTVNSAVENILSQKNAALSELNNIASSGLSAFQVAGHSGTTGMLASDGQPDAMSSQQMNAQHMASDLRAETENGVGHIQETVRSSHMGLSQDIEQMRAELISEINSMTDANIAELMDRMADINSQSAEATSELTRFVDELVNMMEQRMYAWQEEIANCLRQNVEQLDCRVDQLVERLNMQKDAAESEIQNCVQTGLSRIASLSQVPDGVLAHITPDDDDFDHG